jgi:DNA-binding response OmpR family regulator
VKPYEGIRVLIADDSPKLARALGDYIEMRGFEFKIVENGRDARAVILDWKPRFVLCDIVLPEGGALDLVDFIKNEPTLRHFFIHVLVTSRHNMRANVQSAIAAGAKDYIVKPCKPEDIVKRLIFHARSYRQLSELSQREFSKNDEASLVLKLTDLVLRQALSGSKLPDILYNLTRMVAMKVDGVRCSVIQCESQTDGFVVTSNDSRDATGIKLDLNNYPEVLHVMNTQSMIAIENINNSKELSHVREKVKDYAFNSMVLSPVTRHGKPFGVLSLRMPPEKQTVSDNEIRFVEIVSHVISLCLGAEIHKESKDFWRKDTPATGAVVALRSVKNS